MIYYTSASGQIIGGTAGSDLTGITHLPSGADYAVYIDDATVSSVNPNNLPGTYSMTNVTVGPVYTVPTATGTLTFTEQSQADQLAAAQSAKIAELRIGYAQTMAGGFNATIGTTSYTFGWSTDDKSNLDATQTAIDRGFLTFPIQYSDINGHPVTLSSQTDMDVVEHTATNFFSAQHQQILTSIGNAQAATTVSSVNAIKWTPATY